MYHYTESGLSNVYLENGYNVTVLDGEEYVGITDVDSLHHHIAKAIVDGQTPMSGEQFRFLRIELDMSQKDLADIFGLNEQTIARYEKGKTSIPRTADAMLRIVYSDTKLSQLPATKLLNELQVVDESHECQFIMVMNGNGWALSQHELACA